MLKFSSNVGDIHFIFIGSGSSALKHPVSILAVLVFELSVFSVTSQAALFLAYITCNRQWLKLPCDVH